MQEQRQPGEIAQDAIASITMISREAIRAIVGIHVEANPSPSPSSSDIAEHAPEGTTGLKTLGAQVAEKAAADQVQSIDSSKVVMGERAEKFAGSDSGAGIESADAIEGQAAEEKPAQNPQGFSPSPNELVRAQMGGGGIAAVASQGPSPNDIVRGAAAPAAEENDQDQTATDLDADTAEKEAAAATGAKE